MQSVARWHRRLALLVMAWLVFLAVTGFMINHAEDWGLDRAPLAGSLQRWVYGLEPEKDIHCEGLAAAGMDCSRVFSRLALPMGSLLLSADSLWLFDDAGELLERLPVVMTGLANIQSGLQRGDDIYLRGEGRVVKTGPDLLEFQALDDGQVETLASADWQSGTGTAVMISWERFFLDLHAARFLGPAAKAFNDLMAFLILALAITGAALSWLKRKGNENGKD
jgi:hypothetical protein